MSESMNCVYFRLVVKQIGGSRTQEFSGVYPADHKCGYDIFTSNAYKLVVPGSSNWFFGSPSYQSVPTGDSLKISTAVGASGYDVKSAGGYAVDTSQSVNPQQVSATSYTRTFQSEDTDMGTVSLASGHTRYTYDGKAVLGSDGGAVFCSALPKKGYKFVEWQRSDKAQPDTSATIGIPESTAADVTATAYFEEACCLTYDLAGGTPSGSASQYDDQYEGSDGRVTLAPAPTKTGYEFGGWDVGGTTYAAGATIALESDETATALWVGHKSVSLGYQLPQNAPVIDDRPFTPPLKFVVDGGNVYANVLEVAEGKTVQAKASRNDANEALYGMSFSGWTANRTLYRDGVALDEQAMRQRTVIFTMPNATVNLTAVFARTPVSLSATVDSASAPAVSEGVSIYDAMTGSYFPDANRAYGDVALVVAPEPSEGFFFDGWYSDGAKVSDDRSYSIELTGDVSLVAKYAIVVVVGKTEAENASGQVLASVGGRGLAGSGFVVLGDTLDIEAVVTEGAFAGWSVDGEPSGLLMSDSVVVTAPQGGTSRTFIASFVATAELVIVRCESAKNSAGEAGNAGTLEIQGASGESGESGIEYEVAAYSAITLVATPAAQSALPFFRIVKVVGTSSELVSTSATATVNLGGSGAVFRALWGSPSRFTVSVEAEDSSQGIAYVGSSMSSQSAVFDQDSEATVTAVPFNGYKFVGWYADGVKVSDKVRYSFSVAGAVALTASFAADDVAICAWEGGDRPKRFVWQSRVYTLPRPFDPVAARIDATDYPVSLEVATMSSPKSSPDAEERRRHEVEVVSQDGRRLPRMRPERFLTVRVSASCGVDAVAVGTNMAEVN